MKAYFHDNLPGDQRLPHFGQETDVASLKELGVIALHLETMAEVDELAAQRNYANRDEVDIRPATMGDAYESKLAMFIDEHLHDDEEIRYITDGEGYFDVRDRQDRWVRCQVSKGDLLILPPGIYHRFTPSSSDYIKAVRLFKEEPKWVPHARTADTDDFASRRAYEQSIA